MNQLPYESPRPDLPEALSDLYELALDLRWSWSHVADDLWRYIDAELWYQTQNPWLILQTVSHAHLNKLAQDQKFIALLQEMRAEQLTAQAAPGWIETNNSPSVGYFSMEFGLSEALPIYSGGLGVLAGDHLKSSSESGLNLTAVGLLYQQGYFRQGLDAAGRQLAFYPYNDPTQLPVRPARDAEGEWLHVNVALPGRNLYLRLWQARVGRILLYLLDSNTPLNTPADRGITSELYGGGLEMRLQQELVLGMGGYRALVALGHNPDVCHLNEGHAAFVVLERARELMRREQVSLDVALIATRAGNLFTTHTPVAAGFDRFPPALFCQYLEPFAQDLQVDCRTLLDLGRYERAADHEPFNMAVLAARGSLAINAVSRLHEQVSQRLFQNMFPRWPHTEVPIGHITNGVHVPTWDSEQADTLWTKLCGKARWLEPRGDLEQSIHQASDAELWEMRGQNRQALIAWLRHRMTCQSSLGYLPATEAQAIDQVLDPNALTIGFARRFATYKRPNLLLYDRQRLAHLLTQAERPVQLVIAGKAHPQDHNGQNMIQQWIEFIRDFQLSTRVLYVIDYDLMVANQLVQGVDLWLNTPRRPWEASGTSGMKVLVNGGLNLSELDGWWAEAYTPDVGWCLGDGLEHDHDPAYDTAEANALYKLLEDEVVPQFYTRDTQGIPTAWVARMRNSMARLTPFFSTNRMVQNYYQQYYQPLAAAYAQRSADGAQRAKALSEWLTQIERHWDSIHLGNVGAASEEEQHTFTAQVYLDDLHAEDVQVQLYADARDDFPQCTLDMAQTGKLAGAINGFTYALSIAAERPVEDYTVRIIPHHSEAQIPLESAHILWQR